MGVLIKREIQVKPHKRYASYMLRLQWTYNDDQPTWLVSMQSTETGELCWFPNLDALVQFLGDEFGNCRDRQSSNPPVLTE